MHGVSSSTVDEIGYSPISKEMRIGFKSGSTYKYDDVPLNDFIEFENAPSKGKYVWYQIRQANKHGSKYPYEKIG